MGAGALTAASASAVSGFAGFAARPWARAMPSSTLRTPSLSVRSWWPLLLWIAAMAARWSRTMATERRRSSARWERYAAISAGEAGMASAALTWAQRSKVFQAER